MYHMIKGYIKIFVKGCNTLILQNISFYFEFKRTLEEIVVEELHDRYVRKLSKAVGR